MVVMLEHCAAAKPIRWSEQKLDTSIGFTFARRRCFCCAFVHAECDPGALLCPIRGGELVPNASSSACLRRTIYLCSVCISSSVASFFFSCSTQLKCEMGAICVFVTFYEDEMGVLLPPLMRRMCVCR